MKKIILSLAVASTLAMANNQVEINLNNDTLELVGDFYLNNKYEVSNDANYYAIASYLGSENDNSNTSRILSAGVKLLNPFADDNGLSLGLGMKMVLADDNNKNFIVTPLSVYAKYEYSDLIHLDAEVGYAPKTLSFRDAEKYQDMKLKVNYKVLENGFAFIGVRGLETTYVANETIKYDNSMFFGYKVQY